MLRNAIAIPLLQMQRTPPLSSAPAKAVVAPSRDLPDDLRGAYRLLHRCLIVRKSVIVHVACARGWSRRRWVIGGAMGRPGRLPPVVSGWRSNFASRFGPVLGILAVLGG